MANNGGAANITSISDDTINTVKKTILDRVAVVAGNAYSAAEKEMDEFISTWKALANATDLVYWIGNTKTKNRLLSYYGQYCAPTEKATLNSMRDVEQSSTLFHFF